MNTYLLLLRMLICLNRANICALLFTLLLCAQGFSTEKIVLYGDDDYPPYSYVENGQFKGLYLDILKKVSESLKPEYDVELKPIPWKRGLADLESGASFALFPPGLKLERTYIKDYSVPIYKETVVLFCNTLTNKKKLINFPNDFIGLKVATNSGFLLSDRLIQEAKSNRIILIESSGNDSNLRKLALKKVDCYASDRLAALYSFKRIKSEAIFSRFELTEVAELSSENTYIGYSGTNNPTYKTDFILKANTAIESLRKSGGMSKLIDSYLR